MNKFIFLLLSSLLLLTACEKRLPTLNFDWVICEAGADSQEVLLETNREVKVQLIQVSYASDSKKNAFSSKIELNDKGYGYFMGDWFILEVENGETCQIRISAAPNNSGYIRWLSVFVLGYANGNPPQEEVSAVFYQLATGTGRSIIKTPDPKEKFQREHLKILPAEKSEQASHLMINQCKSFWVKDEAGKKYQPEADDAINGPWFTIYKSSYDRYTRSITWSANETGHWRFFRFYVERNDGKLDETLVVQQP